MNTKAATTAAASADTVTSIWVTGPARSGKTQTAIDWLDRAIAASAAEASTRPDHRAVLVLAAPGGSRLPLGDRVALRLGGRRSLTMATPTGWAQSEVHLFYPWLAEALEVPAVFPTSLRSENEQELAARLWEPLLDRVGASVSVAVTDRAVRTLLDWYQLAAASGIAIDEGFGERLAAGLGSAGPLWTELAAAATEALQGWRRWCLERGLLTYAIATDLYDRVLLPQGRYHERLCDRFGWFLADDTDEFPAIAAKVCAALLDGGSLGAMVWSTDGGARRGLGADPEAMKVLENRCQSVVLAPLGDRWSASLGAGLARLVTDPAPWTEMDAKGLERDRLALIKQPSRLQMLDAIAERLAATIAGGHLRPGDIAIIGPGFDRTARYALTRRFDDLGLPWRILNVQEPLVERPMVRALLTLLALVYDDLGDTVELEDVTQMLVTLSRSPIDRGRSAIDLVRAGLLTDVCFANERPRPKLLSPNAFDRWDRLGRQPYRAADAIRTWIEDYRHQNDAADPDGPLHCLDRAIAHFLVPGSNARDLHGLREFVEAARRHWTIAKALSFADGGPSSPVTIAGRFIRLMQRGAIAANPFPESYLQPQPDAIVLATIFQYRISRQTHPVHYWLDIGSPLWPQGGAAELLGADVLLQSWDGQPTTADLADQRDRDRLERLLRDLLARCRDRLVLCHSDLAANGQEQTGPLRALADAISPP